LLNKLVVENLKHRPVRTLLSILAIGIEVTMILTLVGLSRGMLDDYKNRAKGVGADIWVRPPNTSIMQFTANSMPEKLVDFFQKQPHVTIATASANFGAGFMETVSGVDFDRFSQMSGGFRFLGGGPIRQPNEILVDDRYARLKKLRPGSMIRLGDREWRVAGIYESGKLARILLPLPVVQDLAGSTGKVAQIFLKLDEPANAAKVTEALKSQLPDYHIYPIEELTSLFTTSNVQGLEAFTYVVITLGVVVGFLVVFLSMYTAVLERTREIGILKSMGASSGYILGILLRETMVLAVVGATLGVLMSYGTQYLINNFTGPALTQTIVPDWWPITAIIAISGAQLGTLYPGMKAVHQDALEALSYD